MKNTDLALKPLNKSHNITDLFVFQKKYFQTTKMAWRFKASKFKNAAPIVPKPESCVRDISVGSYQTYGNNISASAAFMAFNVDHNGK